MAKHFVSNKNESVDMFDSKFLNFFSRVHWSIPLIIYVPFVIYLLYHAIAISKTTLWMIPLLFLGGLAFWTLAEYVLHRFVFHWQPPGKLGERIHFVFHGVHHDYPNDSWRLVMPPPLSIPLAVLFYFIYYYTFGPVYFAGFFAGFVVGYLVYDMTHYALHHANIKTRFWKELKDHHMVHHYHDPENGFGVSNMLWDQIFRTTFNIRRKNHTVGEVMPMDE